MRTPNSNCLGAPSPYVPEPATMRSSLDVQKAVEFPHVPGELALLSELPGEPSRTPPSCRPAPPKFAKLNTLKAETVRSTRMRSVACHGQLRRTSIVLSHGFCAGWPGSDWINGYSAPSFVS